MRKDPGQVIRSHRGRMGDQQARDPRTEKHANQNQTDHAKHNPDIRFGKGQTAGTSRSFSSRITLGLALGQVRMGSFVGDFRLHEKTVAFPGDGLDIKRFIGGIAERLAKFVDRGIYIGVVVDVGIGGPEPCTQFFAGDHFPRFLKKCQKNLIDLTLELETRPVPGHFLPLLVNAKRPKMDIAARRQEDPLRSRRISRLSHGDHFR